MSLSGYKPSHLENWISKKYIEMGIMLPGDLEPHNIVAKLNIEFYKDPVTSFCIREDGISYLYLKKGIHPKIQRVQFFHEIFHLFMHSGNQLNMIPKAFRELQERDANHFTRHAAIPLHMLNQFNLEGEDINYELSEVFNVPVELVSSRLENIKRKINMELSRQSFVKELHYKSTTPYPTYQKFSLDKCSDETKRIMMQLQKQLKGEITHA